MDYTNNNVSKDIDLDEITLYDIADKIVDSFGKSYVRSIHNWAKGENKCLWGPTMPYNTLSRTEEEAINMSFTELADKYKHQWNLLCVKYEDCYNEGDILVMDRIEECLFHNVGIS